MKLVLLIVGVLLLIGCSIQYETAEYYEEMLSVCLESSQNQIKYCQCFASCQEELSHLGSYKEGYGDCHFRCEDDWYSEYGYKTYVVE